MLTEKNADEIGAGLEHLENPPNTLHRSLVFCDSTVKPTLTGERERVNHTGISLYNH
jgi:hypothetical protein